MRILTFGAICLAILAPAGPALSWDTCGIAPIPPIPPIGCRAMEPQCVCDGDGNCHWEFICVPD